MVCRTLGNSGLVFYLCFLKVAKSAATFFQKFPEELITTTPMLNS